MQRCQVSGTQKSKKAMIKTGTKLNIRQEPRNVRKCNEIQ